MTRYLKTRDYLRWFFIVYLNEKSSISCIFSTISISTKIAYNVCVSSNFVSRSFDFFSIDYLSFNSNVELSDDRDEKNRSQFFCVFEHDNAKSIVYDVIVRFARIATMKKKIELNILEKRIVIWEQICVLCFFAQYRLIKNEHDNCVRQTHVYNFDIFRRKIRF